MSGTRSPERPGRRARAGWWRWPAWAGSITNTSGERREPIGRITPADSIAINKVGDRCWIPGTARPVSLANLAVWAAFSGRGLPHDSPDTNHADRRPESGPGK